ncbi:MAG: hypothetical protein IPM66_21750 [Acidobacteriota bacterium]|nr:MAG: hypothetical protein IPM66_21750 [Acidobacteriota bacterium]
MAKGKYSINRRELYEKVKGMEHAGMTEQEISKSLSITPSTIQHLAVLFKPHDAFNSRAASMVREQRPELAHELHRAGKSFTEISEILQVSIVRARQMVHRHDWILRHPKLRNDHKH